MAATNINRVVLTGNLTADPELRSLPSGMSVCSLRVACNTRRKNNSTSEWEDKPNYFNVTVWGAQGENAARYLSKGPAPSRSTDGSSGASGRRRTGPSARLSISLLTRCSSWVRATRPQAEAGSQAQQPSERRRHPHRRRG